LHNGKNDGRTGKKNLPVLYIFWYTVRIDFKTGRDENVPGKIYKQKQEAVIRAKEVHMELWDIYDADKKRTGRIMRRNDFHLAEGEYHLTVLGVVARRDGRFLITKRVGTKAWAPGWWEVSGGAAMAGEESPDAARREVLEETGLDVTGWDGGYLFTYHRENPGEGDNYFVDVYRFIGDFAEEDLRLRQEETDGYRLATAEEIRELAEKGIFLHYDSIQEAFLL